MPSILDHLVARPQAWTPPGRRVCPPAEGLIRAGRGQPPEGLTYAQLAQHLLGCPRCAMHWEQIQAAPHVTLGECYALSRSTFAHDPGKAFARCYVKEHLAQCARCRWMDRQVGTLASLMESMEEALHQLGEGLRSLDFATVRTTTERTLEATVVDADGRPEVRGGLVIHEPVEVRSGWLAGDGRLTVELTVPDDCASVQLAVSTGEHPGPIVLLPAVQPCDGVVQFVAETQAGGAATVLPLSHLTVWITRL